MHTRRIVITLIALLAGLAVVVRPAQAQSHTTVTDISFTQLSNGVQIHVVADGILQANVSGEPWSTTTRGTTMTFDLPQARNGMDKNFVSTKFYPVSYAQLATAPNAQNGIGLQLIIKNLVSTSATLSASPDGQGIFITVQSNRTIDHKSHAASAETTTGTATVDTSTRVDFADGKLLILAVHADIQALIGEIALKTGISVAIDDSIDRKVSISLEDADPIQALQAIASAYGLALLKVDGVYMMSDGVPTDLASYHLSGTESFRMQNTQAGTASGLLPNFLYSYVHVNSEQNAVVVTSPRQMLTKIGSDLASVDLPSPQISIQALAVEFTDTKDLDVGLNLGYQTSTSISTLDTPSGAISYNTIGALPSDFEVKLSALESSGRARVRARPWMAAVNGHAANIFIGTQRFIQTQFSQNGQLQTHIQPVNVGVTLAVTPLTGGNGEITVHISPTVSNITQIDLQTGLPLLSSRSADTTVRVKDGETIAIGGLTLDQEQSSQSKIPILGDLPIIGQIFRSQHHSTVKTDLVVFITPSILKDEAK